MYFSAMYRLHWCCWAFLHYGFTIRIQSAKMVIFNLFAKICHKRLVIQPQLVLSYPSVGNCLLVSLICIDFFARGLHTCTVVARLPLHQLGFFVLQNKSIWIDSNGMCVWQCEYSEHWCWHGYCWRQWVVSVSSASHHCCSLRTLVIIRCSSQAVCVADVCCWQSWW